MSINDPVRIVYNKKRQTWYLKQGRETFYDEHRCLREFATADEAAEWAAENVLGVRVQEAEQVQP